MIPFRIPDIWDAAWFRRLYVEVLSQDNVAAHNTDPDAHEGKGFVPAGGIVGQLLTKTADNDYVAEWTTLDVQGMIDASVTAHEAESDPHPDYATDADLTTHVGATDPHPDLIDDLEAASSVAEADYVLVSQSGTNKKATVDQLAAAVFGDDWDDIRFPASQIDPTGLAAPPSRITSLTGYTGGLEFSGTLENVVGGIAQMPHEWSRTALKPHIHWTKPTGSADAVSWRFYYRIVGNPGDTAEAWSAAQSPTATIGDQTVSDEHLITTFPDIDMTGYIESAIVYWRLHRLGNSDAEANVVVLHELDFHFQKNKSGTPDAIPT